MKSNTRFKDMIAYYNEEFEKAKLKHDMARAFRMLQKLRKLEMFDKVPVRAYRWAR